MRRNGLALMGAAMLVIALVAVGCAKSTPSKTSKGTLASTFIFGAPRDCPTNKFCQIGLKNVYGIVFKQVRLLDAGGVAFGACEHHVAKSLKVMLFDERGYCLVIRNVLCCH